MCTNIVSFVMIRSRGAVVKHALGSDCGEGNHRERKDWLGRGVEDAVA